jgi:hypothetical protein
VDLSGGVAVRLSSLCLDPRGRLRDFALWDVSARGALLVDLARTGRLSQDEESVTVDGTPTGFDPADRLLAAIAVEPEQSLDWWLDHGGVRMGDLAEANVASGRWTVHRRLLGRRFTDPSPVAADDRARDPHRLPDGEWAPDTAAVMVLATACGALRPPEPVTDAELSPTGPLRWICEAVTAHLEQAHRQNLLRAGSTDGGGVIPGF